VHVVVSFVTGRKSMHESKPTASSQKIDVRVASVATAKSECDVCLLRAHGNRLHLFILQRASENSTSANVF